MRGSYGGVEVLAVFSIWVEDYVESTLVACASSSCSFELVRRVLTDVHSVGPAIAVLFVSFISSFLLYSYGCASCFCCGVFLVL